MIGKKERNLYLLLLIFLVHCHFSEQNPSGVSVEYITPSRGGFRGGDIVQVYGVGFTTFNEVTCIFDDRWAGFSGVIVKDTVVKCEVPVIDSSEFQSLPFFSTVTLVFDGDAGRYSYPVTDAFLIGPTITSISPTSGFVQGGNIVTISGTSFDNFKYARVYFDSADCPIVSRTNNQIQCTVPEGAFNQNALVTLIFDFEREFYVHATQTYHYGPLLTKVTPGCGSLSGGTFVTITGVNLDDPVISNSQYPEDLQPIVELSFTVNDDDDDFVAGDNRYFGISPSFDGTKVVFQTPNVYEDYFGKQVRIFVQFKGTNAKIAVTEKNAFRYGPIVYNAKNLPPTKTSVVNPTPSSGHAVGGDSITITGCGFSQFPTSLINPVIVQNAETKALCARGAGAGSSSDTLKVSSCGDNTECEQITCIVTTLDCNDDNYVSSQSDVYVQFRPTNSTQYPSYPYVEPRASEDPLVFSLGPQVNTISANSGYYLGGEIITFTGSNFFASAGNTASNPGWSVDVVFTGADGSVVAGGVIQSDTQIVAQTPIGFFNYDTSVSIDFSYGNCVDFPREQFFNFHYGPLCTAVTPSNGFLSGNEAVTVTGSHLSTGMNPSQISPRICLARLNTEGGCTVYESAEQDSTFVVTDTAVTFNTPSIRKNVPTNVGGNRLFGDSAAIYLYYGSIPSEYLFNGVNDQYVLCGEYRFGAVAKKISPTKGPDGPALEDSPSTPIVVSGSGFADPIYDDILITLGEVNTASVQVSDSSLSARTLWGGYADEDVSVNVILNHCNTTSSSSYLHWGPEILSLESVNSPLSTSYNPNADVYGVLPEGGQIITVHGNGFGYYVYSYFDGYTASYYFDGACEIDGVETTTYVVPVIVNSEVVQFDIQCVAPARSFGTEAQLTLKFGYICGDNSVEIDYKKSLTAHQKIFYTPRIDYFTPAYGLTSGGTDVTIVGEGFTGWDTYLCYFGHYTNGIEIPEASVQNSGSSLVCQTPYHRGEFNTDVTVHVELSDNLDMKVWAKKKFHYGPVCDDIVPYSGFIDGGYNATVLGDGFIDCTVSMTEPFYNCTFSNFTVHFSHESNSTSFTEVQVYNLTITDTSFDITIPKGSCMHQPTVQLYFPDVLVTNESQRYVVCENPNRDFFFHYGPLFTAQTSQYYRSGVSYGWKGDNVTITGLNFGDSALGTAVCHFGNTSATSTTVVDNSTIVCVVPEGHFNHLVNVTIAWANCNKTLYAEKFHYGPVIDSISPPRGYVQARTPVTVTGFAFQCCGITSYEFLWPAGASANASNETTFIAPNSVQAPVPLNSNIDAQIDYIGVIFNSTLFSGQNITYLTTTEAGGYLSFYYGPYVYDISPKVSSLSGVGESITVTGEGFLDPYFLATFCDFISTTNGFNDFGSEPVTVVSDTQIVCPVKTYNHVCGDIDNVRPRWERSGTSWRQELGHTYYKTVFNPNQPIGVENQLPYFTDVGSVTPVFYGPVVYGPVITSIEEINQYEVSSFYNSPVVGGLVLKINFNNLDDFLSADVGHQKAMCRFGDRFSDVVDIIFSNDEYFVQCVVPALGEAGWDETALIEVILDPYIDADTIISEDNPSFHWHWLPYVGGFSKSIAQINGREVITIDGGGFCNYDGVVCYFGNNQAIEADVTNDYIITCQTPANAPGYYDVSLQFCEDSECYTLGTFDKVSAPNKFTYAGVTGISPLEGSICGGTPLTVFGYGFKFYDQLTVQFGSEAEVPATVIDDNTLICTTPDLSPLHVNSISFAECSNIVVVGKYGGSINFPMISPVSFEFGSPFPTEAVPNSADVDTVTEIVVNGRYFGGGEIFPNGNYYCKFGDLEPVPAYLYNYTEGDSVDVKYSLICYTPSTFNTPGLVIGDYDLSIQFSCEYPSFHLITVPFSFTQNPRIIEFNPIAGTEVGGTQIQISGRDLGGGSGYFCSFGTLGIDNQIVIAFYDTDHDVIFCQTPANVIDTNQLVDLHISIDGGITWVLADEPFEYVNAVILCDQPFAPEPVVAASSILHPTLLLVVLLILSFF